MTRPLLIGCEYQGDTFCALWLDSERDYILGWMVGVPKEPGKDPSAQAKLRYKDREQAALAYEKKLAELREMVL